MPENIDSSHSHFPHATTVNQFCLLMPLQGRCYPHFTNGETEARRGESTWSISHNEPMGGPRTGSQSWSLYFQRH